MAQQYAKLEQADDAAHLLQGLLEDDYSSELVSELGELADQVSEARRIELLRLGEALLPSHSRDAQLLLTLGRLARAGKLWARRKAILRPACPSSPPWPPTPNWRGYCRRWTAPTKRAGTLTPAWNWRWRKCKLPPNTTPLTLMAQGALCWAGHEKMRLWS